MVCEEVRLGHHVCLCEDLCIMDDPTSQGVSVLAFHVFGICMQRMECGICMQYGGAGVTVVAVAFGMW